MSEQLANFAYTIISGGYTAGSGLLNVTDTATGSGLQPFPLNPEFDVVIIDLATNLPKALLQVIGINSSTQFAVVNNGGIDVNCNAGDIVRCVQTRRSLRQAIIDISRASIYTPPGPVSGWTGRNTGANWTATDSVGDSINIQLTRNASLNWRLLTKTQPSTPYKRVIFVKAVAPWANSSTFGAYFYDGTKLMGIEVLFQANTTGGLLVPIFTLRVEKITNTTTDGSTPATLVGAGLVIASGIWLRLQNDGSTLSFDWSLDGVVWNTLFSEAVGTYITPTDYGVGGVCVTGTASDFVNGVFISDAAG